MDYSTDNRHDDEAAQSQHVSDGRRGRSGSRRRRRATRVSDNPDYDRTADRPPFVSAFVESGERSMDATREVQIDDEAPEEDPWGKEFWEEQRPPHYGGE